MATTGTAQGTDIGVYVEIDNVLTLVSGATSGDLSLSANTIETSNKDTGVFSSFIGGRVSGTISVESMFAYDAAMGFSQLYAKMIAKEAIVIKYSTNETGDRVISANALVSSLGISAPDADVATTSAEFQLSGEITNNLVP